MRERKRNSVHSEVNSINVQTLCSVCGTVYLLTLHSLLLVLFLSLLYSRHFFSVRSLWFSLSVFNDYFMFFQPFSSWKEVGQFNWDSDFWACLPFLVFLSLCLQNLVLMLSGVWIWCSNEQFNVQISASDFFCVSYELLLSLILWTL